jgi:beta-xylosidase
VTLDRSAFGETAGLIVFGTDYAYVGIRRGASGVSVVHARALSADQGDEEKAVNVVPIAAHAIELRVTVIDAQCQFSYRVDNGAFLPIGTPFTAQPGRWVGAKIGLFAIRPDSAPSGYADFDYFRVR